MGYEGEEPGEFIAKNVRIYIGGVPVDGNREERRKGFYRRHTKKGHTPFYRANQRRPWLEK